MGHYISNLRDIEFCLFDLLGRESILGKSIYADLDRETAMGMLEEVKRLAENDLAALHKLLVRAVTSVTSYMSTEQKQLELKMETKLNEYEQKLANWKNDALEQLELDFSDKTITPFFSGKKDSKKREIETILSSTSQYNKNMTSLQGDAYLKVLAVFFNA